MPPILSSRLSPAVISEIALFTDDVGALVDFYRRVLGREPTASWPGGATFDLDGATLFLHESGEAQEGMPPNVDHFALRVADVDAEATRLETTAQDYPWGRSAYLRDPDGRLIELQ
jgi:catechol 2,3-dioxygenase-like lactoylglutathione lyase family enzyme